MLVENRSNSIKKWINRNSLVLGIIVLFITIIIYLSFFGIQKGSDDEWFRQMGRSTNYFKYISARYMMWSSRVFPDSILFFIFSLPRIFYLSLTSFFLILIAYSIPRIFKSNVKIFDVYLIFVLFSFMNFEIIYHTFLWITGSVNYLWPLAIGLYSMIPFADYIFRYTKQNSHSSVIFSIFATILFSISNEQYLIVGFIASCVAHIVIVVRKQKLSILLIIKTIIMFIGLLIMVMSPGNSVRLKSESEKWYPDFNNLSKFAHIKVGINFMVTGIYNNLFSIILLVIISSLILLKKDKMTYFIFFSVIFCLSCMFLFPNFSSDLAQIYNYSLKQFFSLVAFKVVMKNYLVALWLFLVMLIAVYRVATYKIFSILCLFASIFSIVMLWLSPTLFASGSRVFMCAGVLYLIVAYDLISKKLKLLKINKYYCLGLMSIFPLLNLLLPLFLNSTNIVFS